MPRLDVVQARLIAVAHHLQIPEYGRAFSKQRKLSGIILGGYEQSRIHMQL